MTTSPSISKFGKNYQEAVKLIDRGKFYEPHEAIETLKKTARAKFDETVELHIRTGADPRHADQLIRSVVMLPHGTGKTNRVMVFAQGEAIALAREAGADYIGDDETIERIEKEGWADFDVAIATPEMMGRIGRLGRTLGRRGLMPSPRAGTVVQPGDLPRAIRDSKGGRLEFRMDRAANLHIPIGKISFAIEALISNLAVTLDAVTRARTEGIKGQLYRSIHLSTTMGPSISLDIPKALAIDDN